MSAPFIVLPFSEHPELRIGAFHTGLSLVGIELGETARIAWSQQRRAEPPVRVSRDGNCVCVEPAEPHGGPPWERARLVVWLPKNTRIKISAELGKVRAEDLHDCVLDIEASAGALYVRNVHGTLRLHSQAGSIHATDVSGSFDVQTSAGSAKLDINDLAPGTHRIRADMGAVKIGLRRGLDVRINAHTTMGAVRVRYPSRSEAPAVLDLRTELGAVRVSESNGADAHHEPHEWFDPDTWLEGAVGMGARAAQAAGANTSEPDRDTQSRSERAGLEWASRYFAGRDQQAPQGREPPPPAARPVSPGVTEPPAAGAARDDDLKRILQMVQQGAISPAEAEQLIIAMEHT